ncbi:hypothetical protein [Streptomyces sp. SM8]|uniref:hypothetical protein n=1 Tax=Streptomyces sp. SM8 TaxID=1195457 RepID=UPI0002830E73|nr:hypothetical protein [Streptomyces sp. SM8]
MTTPQEQQPRVPGVRYRKVRRTRQETTVIGGRASTRTVEYDAWVPEPPRDWDALILRGAIGVAVGFTAVAIVATTASIGGLLSSLVPTVVAYGMGCVFAAGWLYCLAIEWLNRTQPSRALPARITGWIFLAFSMGAVYAYGAQLGVHWAGGIGACIDVLAKTAWWLLLREYAVPLSPAVAHWVHDQEQALAGQSLLATRLRRLNRRAAYDEVVGGVEYQAASAILAADARPAVTGAAPQTTTEDTGGDRAGTPVPAAPVGPVAPPAPVSPAVPPAPTGPVSTPTGTTSAPASPASPPPADVGPFVKSLGFPVSHVPAAPPAPPAAAVQEPTVQPTPTAPLHVVDGPPVSKTAFIRSVLAETPDIALDDLTTKVRAQFGDKPDLRKDVRRLQARIEGRAS